MPTPYYRSLLIFAAIVSLATAGCGSSNPTAAIDPVTGAAPKLAVNTQRDVNTDPNAMDTETNIFQFLGMAKRPSEARVGPQVGDQVSQSLWMASLETLNFVGIASEDPLTGMLITEWYSPRGKPNERLRVSVFILSYALRADSLSLTIDREERGPDGQWKPSTVDRQTVTDLETAILLRARQIHAETYRATVLAK
jgi:hypothetical protein